MNGKDILIVEDETIVALDMKMRLESLGYRVAEVVDTGLSALAWLERSRPDLVLMDIKLKGALDGIETARKARERVEIPIIFVTAFTDEATLERAKHASPYGYIVKPFHERELRIAIELALYKFQYELSMRRQVELAEEANRLKSEFLSNVSHELKTPLNSVIGFTELALDRAGDEEQREYLTTVLRSARSLSTLIDSILDFARLEKESLAPAYGSFSLEELLGECADFLAVGAASKGLDVCFRRAPGLPVAVVSDRAMVRQVLMNLIDNAVKFTDKGRVRLEASMESPSLVAAHPDSPTILETGSSPFTLRLLVEDTGIGIPQAKIETVFERFTQLDGSTTRSAGGTGLGLAIVAKSVKLLGGRIKVESAVGAGSRFEILLPAWGNASKARRSGLEGCRFEIEGFSDEARADISEALAALGAKEADRGLVSRPAKTLVVMDEKAASALAGKAAGRGGQAVVTCRPGCRGKAALAAAGCLVLPYPFRVEALLSAMEGLTETARPGLGKMDPPPAEPGSPAEAGFEAFLSALEAALGAADLEEAERAAKTSREAFIARGDEAAEKTAFQALLLARKGDLAGLADLARRARLASAAVAVHNGDGGRPDAIPGR